MNDELSSRDGSSECTLGGILRAHPPGNPAIIFDDKSYSYGELDYLSNKFGNLYRHLGLVPQSRVSFMLGNDILLVAAYLGAFKTNIIANALGSSLKAEEVAYILEHAGSQLLITSSQHAAVIEEALGQLATPPKVVSIDVFGESASRTLQPLPFSLLMEQSESAPQTPDPDFHDIALLLYTSGTTGKPKGVMITHRNILCTIFASKSNHTLGPSDRTLCVMPLSHNNALMFSTLSHLCAGATTVLCRRFSASQHWTLCKKYDINNFSASPTILAILLETPPCVADEGAGLRFVKVASAPTSIDLAQRFETRFGKGLLLESYGLTEASGITMNPIDGPRKHGSIGKVLPQSDVRIVNNEGVQVPVGEVGELLIQTPTLMKGYLHDAEATAKAIENGWFHSGDLGKIDEDGFIFLVGRKKEMIIRGGENISPLEVERVIARHPAVREAAAFGMPDPMWGEIVMACVTLHEASERANLETNIIGFCKSHLASFKVPQKIAVIDELPRNGVGKIKRHELYRHFHPRSDEH
ncbi:MAG: class I adenylate-forming enzyme family protein [Advenella sp.]